MFCAVSNTGCKMRGTVFDIKEFTVHDGPGARVTVFLKGCTMRCIWCHNPEGLSPKRQLLYKENLCAHCGECKKPCDHEECREWGRCIYVCLNGALGSSGIEITSEELAEKLYKNADIMEAMGGGVTFSGGEPLLQADFVSEVADLLGTRVHKAIQTSGYAPFESYKKVVDRMDYVLQDIKLFDREEHERYTGVSNERILENIEYLKASGKEFVFRLPLIPNITDAEKNLSEISRFVGSHKIELMPYNPLAGAKYRMVGMDFAFEEHIGREAAECARFFENAVVLK